MHIDRIEIYKIINKIADNEGEHLFMLEKYVEKVRAEAIGWALADCCVTLDRGEDPRLLEVPDQMRRALVDLGQRDLASVT